MRTNIETHYKDTTRHFQKGDNNRHQSEQIRMNPHRYPNKSESIRTFPNKSESIRTFPNKSTRIDTNPHESTPIRTNRHKSARIDIKAVLRLSRLFSWQI